MVLGAGLRLGCDLALLVENANGRARQRNIQPDTDIHCRCHFLQRNWGAPCGKTP